VDDIKLCTVTDCLPGHIFIHVIIVRRESRYQALNMPFFQVGHNIDIIGQSRFPVGDGSNRSGDQIRDLKMFNNIYNLF